eukprot:62917_1
MATFSQTEGISDDLCAWLKGYDLQQYEQALRAQAIKSSNDFKYIKSKKHFEQLVAKLGDNVPFMDVLRLEHAWLSIVPHPDKPEPHIHFLGEKEKEIITKICQRFDHLSEDINIVQKAFNEFNQSVVQCKQQINGNAEKMITSINHKKEELLREIDAIDVKNEKRLNDLLNKLQKMNTHCLKSKEQFTHIATNTDIAENKKVKQLAELLSINVDDINAIDGDDDQKEDDAYNHYKYIGDQCVIPTTTALAFNEQAFKNTLDSCIVIKCDDVASKWTLQQRYDGDIDIQDSTFCFDIYEPNFIKVTMNGTIAIGAKNCSYSIISTKTGFSKGVHEWKIKFLKILHHHSNPGIITNVNDLCSVKRGYNQLKNSAGSKCCGTLYMWHDWDKQLQGYHDGVLTLHQGCSNINVNDIITVVLDCDNWTLTFLRNEQHIGSMNITPAQTYHPCIYTCACKGQQYQLLSV